MSLDHQELLDIYKRFNLRIVYWERIGDNPKDWKGPNGATNLGWNAPDRTYPIEQYNPAKMNIGVFTGHEVAPGKFLHDVDLDWAPGIPLAKTLLPDTGLGFGRVGKRLSHGFYTLSDRLDYVGYHDIKEEGSNVEGQTFVEIFSGNSTHQTMVAPSLHSPNTYIELVKGESIRHIEARELEEAVLDYAIGCLLLKRLPGGLHHNGRMALAGMLFKRDISKERIQKLMEAVCGEQANQRVPEMSHEDIVDCKRVVDTTAKKIVQGKKIAGAPKFVEFCGPRGKEIVAQIEEWLNSGSYFIRDTKGNIVAKSQENIRRALDLLEEKLSYNEFSDKLLVNDKPLEDPQVIGLYMKIDREYHFSAPFDYFKMVIKDTAWQNRFHPVKQYLDSLVWDQKPRIDTWLIEAAKAEDSDYVRAVSSIMLVAAVRRIREPGCKYDEMVVWESHQGADKSSAAQALCPNPNWFSDDLPLNLQSQKLIEATLGKWIIEASDLAGKRKTEIEQLKAMLSRGTDGPARMAYAHFPVDRPRHFIFIGTTNSSVYLTDPTGARRFWPITVYRFNIDWIKQNREQLWAEAVVRERNRESIRLPERLWPIAGEEQEKRRELDAWEDAIAQGLDRIETRPLVGKKQVATSTIWIWLGIDISKRDRVGAIRISEIMHRLGYVRTKVYEDGKTQAGYQKK